MFLQLSVILLRGGCIPSCLPPDGEPPEWRTPLWMENPPDGDPPDGEPPRIENPPRMENPPMVAVRAVGILVECILVGR